MRSAFGVDVAQAPPTGHLKLPGGLSDFDGGAVGPRVIRGGGLFSPSSEVQSLHRTRGRSGTEPAWLTSPGVPASRFAIFMVPLVYALAATRRRCGTSWSA
jgi:hypothetical protein